MSRIWCFVRTAGLLLALSLSSAMPAAAQPVPAASPLPIETFFAEPKMRTAQLSPSGRWLVALTSLENSQVGFLIVDLQTMRQTFVEAATKDDIAWFRWVNDDWIIFSVSDPTDRSNVYEMQGSGLMAMRRDGSDSRMIIARRWDAIDALRARREFGPNHDFASLGAPGTSEIILIEYLDHDSRDMKSTPTRLKTFDLATADVRAVPGDLPRGDDWWFDAWGRPRVTASRNGEQITYQWADKSGRWREIGTMPWDKRRFEPAYVEGDDQLVVSTVDNAGHLELRRFNLDSGKPAAEPIVATPGFEGAVNVRRVRGTGKVLGVDLEVDSRTTVWFSPTAARIQAEVDAKLPGRINLIDCTSCDASTEVVLVHSYSAQDPGRFVLYRPQQGTWQQISAVRPEIDPARMAGLDLHRIKARDGLDLPVWITRPANAPAGKSLPAVVMVHGGPWVRGTDWRWENRRQFLASRGYVVVEPEFRGSSGYGAEHERAGYKQWGKAMQDDVTDALRFAVKSGWVDASRVCIMGGSFGGYSTMMGLVKDPDQYRCGIALAAVSDPRHMYEFTWNDIGRFSRNVELPLKLGDPKADEAMLVANSPLVHAERIKAPLMIVHGGRDRRVPIQNGERMRDALVKLGKPVEWVLYEDEYHGFFYKKNEFDYWRRVEAFLAKHLKGQ